MPISVRADVSHLFGNLGLVETAAWVFLPAPEQLHHLSGVVFAFPGGGYSKSYYHFEEDGFTGYSMAEHLTEMGMVFVACDHPGIGDSTPLPADALSWELMAACNHETVTQVMSLLTGAPNERMATLEPDSDGAGLSRPDERSQLGMLWSSTPVIGVGHAMGACLVTVQQARYRTFDAVGILGWTAVHMQHRVPAYLLPSEPEGGVVAKTIAGGWPLRIRTRWLNYAFHGDDVPRELIEAQGRTTQPIPPCVTAERGGMGAPGVVRSEAADIDVPLFLAFGERDVSPNPWAEPASYPRSPDISLYIGKGGAHCLNFAGGRQHFYDRLGRWAEDVVARTELRLVSQSS